MSTQTYTPKPDTNGEKVLAYLEEQDAVIQSGQAVVDELRRLADVRNRELDTIKAQRLAFIDMFCEPAPVARPYMTVTAASKALCVSRGMVIAYIRDGLLEDSPVGDTHRIPAASLAGLVEQRIAAGDEAVRLVSEEPDNPRVLAARQKARQSIAARDEH
jgi:hypothetical protein